MQLPLLQTLLYHRESKPLNFGNYYPTRKSLLLHGYAYVRTGLRGNVPGGSGKIQYQIRAEADCLRPLRISTSNYRSRSKTRLSGKPLRMTLDMMVLLVGMESSEGSRQMADTLGLNLAPNGFIKFQDPHYRNNNTNVEGIFVAGCEGALMNT